MEAIQKKAQLAAVYQQLAEVHEELLHERERKSEALQTAQSSEQTNRDLQASVQELEYVNKKLQQRLDATKVAAAHAADLDRKTISSLRSNLLEQEQQIQALRSQGATRVQDLYELLQQLHACQADTAGAGATCSSSNSGGGISASAGVQAAMEQVYEGLADLAQGLAADGMEGLPAPPQQREQQQQQQKQQHVQRRQPGTCSSCEQSTGPSNQPAPGHCLLSPGRSKAIRDPQCGLQQPAGKGAAVFLAELAQLQADKLLLQGQVEQLQQQVCSSGEALSSLSRQHQELAQLHRETSQQLSTLQSATLHADTLMGAQDQDIALALQLLQRGPGSGSRRPPGRAPCRNSVQM